MLEIIGDTPCLSCKTTVGPGSTTYAVGETSKSACVCRDSYYNQSNGPVTCDGMISTEGMTSNGAVREFAFACARCPPCALCRIADQVFPAYGFWNFKKGNGTKRQSENPKTSTRWQPRNRKHDGRVMFACNTGGQTGCSCSRVLPDAPSRPPCGKHEKGGCQRAEKIANSTAELIGCTGHQRGDCAEGYLGIACGQCDLEAGFGRYGGQCVQCSSAVSERFQTTLAVRVHTVYE